MNDLIPILMNLASNSCPSCATALLSNQSIEIQNLFAMNDSDLVKENLLKIVPGHFTNERTVALIEN